MTKTVKYGGANIISVAWSFDGQKIGLPFGVHTYDVTSCIGLFVGELQSNHNPQLWSQVRSYFATIRSFPPTNSRVSLSTYHSALDTLERQSSNCLSRETGSFYSHRFSSDTSFYAVSQEGSVHLWKYDSGHYIRWRKFWCHDLKNSLPAFPRFILSPVSFLGDPPGAVFQ